jgi:phosphate transport system substrate-binding protein
MHGLKYFNKAGIIEILTVVVLIFVVLSAGCIGTSNASSEVLSIVGSTTLFSVVHVLANYYTVEHPTVDIQISGGGSSVGIAAVASGSADVGMISCHMSDAEKEGRDLREHVIGRDGIAIINHPSNSVSALTLSQVKDIYQGKITNWKEIGGADTEIVIIGRDSASGTRSFFTEFVLRNEDTARTMQELNSNGAVQKCVSQTPGAIGYVSLEYVDSTVKALTIDGAPPSITAITDGTYKITRPLILITKGEPTGLAKKFIEFVLSDIGQKIISDKGFVSIV